MGLWPMLPGLERYLGFPTALMFSAAIWAVCAVLLSVPWALCWTQNRAAHLWRVPVTILATIAPPLGLVGFLSPVLTAGFLFPGFGWIGLLLTVVLPGSLLALQRARRGIVAAVVMLSVAAQLFSPRDRHPPGWEAINTRFGDVSRPFKDYEVAQFIQEGARRSSARVLIFPEFLVPRWSEATEAFWSRTLAQSRVRGQTLAIGVGVPRPLGSRMAKPDYDFRPSIAALETTDPKASGTAVQPSWTEPFDNTLLVLGEEMTIYRQRVPVPLGMWRPWSSFSVPLRLSGSGVVGIDGQRAAVLICYEQLIPFPVLLSMLERPTVIVGISNTFWFDGTSIPRYQQSAIYAWARLFGIPVLTAVNS